MIFLAVLVALVLMGSLVYVAREMRWLRQAPRGHVGGDPEALARLMHGHRVP